MCGLRGAAIGATGTAVVLAAAGVRLLFSGDWLEGHEIRVLPLAMIIAASMLSLVGIGCAAIALRRRPRSVIGWLLTAVVMAPLPVGLLSIGALGVR